MESADRENNQGLALASGHFLTEESRGYGTSRSIFSRTDATHAWEVIARIAVKNLGSNGRAEAEMQSTAIDW